MALKYVLYYCMQKSPQYWLILRSQNKRKHNLSEGARFRRSIFQVFFKVIDPTLLLEIPPIRSKTSRRLRRSSPIFNDKKKNPFIHNFKCYLQLSKKRLSMAFLFSHFGFWKIVKLRLQTCLYMLYYNNNALTNCCVSYISFLVIHHRINSLLFAIKRCYHGYARLS